MSSVSEDGPAPLARRTTRGRHTAERQRGRIRLLGTAPLTIVSNFVNRSAPTSAGIAITRSTTVRDRSTRKSLPVAGDAGGVLGPEASRDDSVLCIVAEGESIADIAARYGVSTASLLARNGLSWRTPITPGDVIRIRPAERAQEAGGEPADLRRHRVVPGDTASAVAAGYGIATAALLLANGLSRTSELAVGRELVLPRARPSVAATRTELVLSGTMRVHAQLIMEIGAEAGVGEHGVLAALVAAMQDSALHNLDATRPDAPAGLFLQHPADGWGTAMQVRDADHAVRAFFGGPIRPAGTVARGLFDVGGWRLMSVGEAAAAVQRQGSAAAYEKWLPCAEGWLRQLGRTR